MDLKFKDYVYITFITITPFLLLLLSLKFFANENLIMNNMVFWVLISFLILIFIITLIISLLYTINHIRNNQKGLMKVIHVILLFVFNIIYVPLYYGFFMVKEKLLGIFMPIVTLMSIILFSFASKNYILDYFEKLDQKNIIPSNILTYLSKNNLFTLELNSNYSCNNDLGDYVVSCDNQSDDSFLGIYSYQYSKYSLGQLDDMYNFHLDQTKEYIEEAGYVYEESINGETIVLTYNEDMCVLFKSIDYDINNDDIYDYRLIIIKEVSYSENIISEFDNLITSIKFID